MRVLVFEQWRGGHYFDYLECLLPRLSELASEVVVTLTKRALESEEFETKVGACRAFGNIRFESSIPDADPSLPLRERLTLLMHLRDAVARTKPDYVLVTSADSQTLAMGALGHLGLTQLPKSIPSEATFHSGYGPALATIKHFMKEAVYRFAFSGCSWTRLNFVNFLYYEYILRHHCRWAGRVRLVPHPVANAPRLTRSEARSLLDVPQDGRYLGILGSLDARKAVPELLAAFRAAKLGATDRLLLAGRLDPDFRSLIAREYGDLLKSERLVLIDRFMTDREVNQGYGALDLVCTTYRDFPGVAGLMLKGLSAGRPVVGHDFGWSRALIRRFGVGCVVNVSDTHGFAQTLRSALEASANYIEPESTKRLLAYHDTSNFTETMLDQIRRAVGKPGRHPLRTWDWVLEALKPEYRSMR
jgi:glycosyltransferase involved in cell wall biosynthesis